MPDARVRVAVVEKTAPGATPGTIARTGSSSRPYVVGGRRSGTTTRAGMGGARHRQTQDGRVAVVAEARAALLVGSGDGRQDGWFGRKERDREQMETPEACGRRGGRIRTMLHAYTIILPNLLIHHRGLIHHGRIPAHRMLRSTPARDSLPQPFRSILSGVSSKPTHKLWYISPDFKKT